MAKKVVSSALHTKKPIKKRRRLRTIFQKFFNYMKSDTYMFSPLIYYPQSSATFSPASLGEGFGEPIKKKQELEEYLKCDCYMYAPMVLESAVETASAPTGKEKPSVHFDLVGPRKGKTMRDGGNMMDSFREFLRDDSYTPTRQTAIKHALVHDETVKHVVHQNCHPTSIQGKGLLQKETRKIVVE